MGSLVPGVVSRRLHVEGPAVEYITNLVIPTGVTAGTILCNMVITPNLMPFSRLNALGRIYAQYRFRSLWVELLPACSSATDGSIVVALDKNITYNVNGGATSPAAATNLALGYAMGVETSMTGPIWQRYRLQADCRKTRQELYETDISGTLEENTQFRLLVVVAIPTTNPSGGASLMMRFGYNVEFDTPISSAIGALPVAPNYVDPAGTMLSISAQGRLTGTTWSIPAGLPSNGLVYAINPTLSRGITAGSLPAAAFVTITKSDGTVPVYFLYPSVAEALAAYNQTGTILANLNSPINGLSSAFPVNTDITYVAVAKINIGYYA